MSSDGERSPLPPGPFIRDGKMIFPTPPQTQDGPTASELFAAQKQEERAQVASGDRSPDGKPIIQLKLQEEKEADTPSDTFELEVIEPVKASTYESTGRKMTQQEKDDDNEEEPPALRPNYDSEEEDGGDGGGKLGPGDVAVPPDAEFVSNGGGKLGPGDVAVPPLSDADEKEMIQCNRCGMKIAAVLMFNHRCTAPLRRAEPKSPEDFDLEDRLERENKKLLDKEVEENGQQYAMAQAVSDRHKNRREEMLKELIKIIIKYKDQFGDLADLDGNPTNPGALVPTLIRALGGPKTKVSITMASNILWFWTKNHKNTKAKPGECPLIQPDTMATYLRTIMSMMKEMFDWWFDFSDFKFNGGLEGRIKQLHEDRAKAWPTYETGENFQRPNVDSVTDIDISVFNEDNPDELMLKVMLCLSLYFALRGSKEHVTLKVANVKFGVFEPGHEFAGKKSVNVTGHGSKSEMARITAFGYDPKGSRKRKREEE